MGTRGARLSHPLPSKSLRLPGMRRTTALLLFQAIACLAAPSGAWSQAVASVAGRILDRTTARPVVDALVILGGTGREAVTNSAGVFRLEEVPAGEYRLEVRHLAYGVHADTVHVGAGRKISLEIALSPEAIELEPLQVEVYSARDLRARASGVRFTEVTRPHLEAAAIRGMDLADLLRTAVPSIRVMGNQGLAGHPVCIEFRGARFGIYDGICRSPAVYLDGVPIQNPTYLYGTLPAQDVARMEVVPPAEAGVRFGTGALWGALVIETVPPGARGRDEELRLRNPETGSFDWSREPSPHNWRKSLAFSLVANGLGLMAGVALAERCIEIVPPSYDRLGSRCPTWSTLLTATAAVALPAAGAGLGATLGGRTTRSQGVLTASMIAGAMALVPGYALVISSRRSEWRKTGMVGKLLLAVGAPVAATLSDGLFRMLRSPDASAGSGSALPPSSTGAGNHPP